jgi:hypothetical protein
MLELAETTTVDRAASEGVRIKGTDVGGCRNTPVIVLDEFANDTNETADRDARVALNAPDGHLNPECRVEDIKSKNWKWTDQSCNVRSMFSSEGASYATVWCGQVCKKLCEDDNINKVGAAYKLLLFNMKDIELCHCKIS